MKKRKQLIIGIVVVILLVVIIITFCNKTEIYIREEKINNEEIEHIALVHRYENYAWGHEDYILIIDDGIVYYEDFVSNSDEYETCQNDLLSMILSVYENDQKMKYKVEGFKESFLDQLYKTNYNWFLYSEERMIDAGSYEYYCLIKMSDGYKLVKLKQWGDYSQIPLNKDYNDICEYIDSIEKDIYNEK